MLRRLFRVLLLVLQPLDPTSRFGAWLEVFLTLLTAGALAFVPFLAAGWTLERAAIVVLGVFAALSFWAAYRSSAEREAVLGGTRLQTLIVLRLRGGEELRRRIKRKSGQDLPRNLVQEVVEWGGLTIRAVNEIAPDIGSDLYDKMGFTPQSLGRQDALNYLRSSLATLRKIARDLE